MDYVHLKKDNGLNYQKLKPELLTLFEATANKLDREWDKRYGPLKVNSAKAIFTQLIRIATNTYGTIAYICADTPDDPFRKPEFALSSAPLVRSLFEELIMIVFLLEDIPGHFKFLFKTGYAEKRAELDHVTRYHGSLSEWQPYIDQLTERIKYEEKELKLTPHEIEHPDNIGKWPTPGRVRTRLMRENTSPEILSFIEYVNSWMYRYLSGQTHLSLQGIVHRGMHFYPEAAKEALGDGWEEKLKDQLLRYRMTSFYCALTIMLAIMSEIEIHFAYGLLERCRYLWTFVAQYSDITKDFWTTRYANALPS
jgi:hypothetical protein